MLLNIEREKAKVLEEINKIGEPKNQEEARRLASLERSYAMYHNQTLFSNKQFYSIKNRS